MSDERNKTMSDERNKTMSDVSRTLQYLQTLGMPRKIRQRGLLRLLLALVLIPAGALVFLAASDLGLRVTVLLAIPLLMGLAMLPWSAHELLLGRNWGEGRPLVRLLLIATVLPMTILPLVRYGYALREDQREAALLQQYASDPWSFAAERLQRPSTD